MRTKNGDCHQFCPSYTQFVQKNEEYKRLEYEKRAINYCDDRWKRKSDIERINARKKG